MSHDPKATERELTFLRYLDALDSGDAEGIATFLSAAETDDQLEAMLIAYHAQEEEKLMNITELVQTNDRPKRKRKPQRDVNRWWRWGAIASWVLMLLGGGAAFFGLNVGAPLPADVPAEGECFGRVRSDENTINFYGGDVERLGGITAGINQPFTVRLPLSDDANGYEVTYNGMDAFVRENAIELHGNCFKKHGATVYPHADKDFSGGYCEINIPDASVDAYDLQAKVDGVMHEGRLAITAPVTLAPAPPGNYTFEMANFNGKLPHDSVWLRGTCETFPLLYVP